MNILKEDKNDNYQKLTLPRYDEIRSEAVRTIIDQLGITKAAFFIRESMFQKQITCNLKKRSLAKDSS